MNIQKYKMNFVIDTSFFSNATCFKRFGENPTVAFCNFVRDHDYKFYITPTVWEELIKFITLEAIDASILGKITLKAPKRNVTISAQLLHDFLCESRARIDSSIKYAISVTKDAYKAVPEKKVGKIEPEAPYIKKIRDGIRHHMRENILDSGTDLDVILLAKELDAYVLTSDKGVIIWCDKFGVKRMLPEFFGNSV